MKKSYNDIIQDLNNDVKVDYQDAVAACLMGKILLELYEKDMRKFTEATLTLLATNHVQKKVRNNLEYRIELQWLDPLTFIEDTNRQIKEAMSEQNNMPTTEEKCT